MTFTTLTPLDRTAATFRDDCDTFFGTDLPRFVTEGNAMAAQMTAAANGGGFTIGYVFSTTTTDADPGAGNLRLSNATQNVSTTIRADLTDVGATDWSSVLDTFDDSTSTVKGQIRLTKLTDGTKWLAFNVTAVASPSGYRNITVANIGSSAASPFSNGDYILMTFTRTGDKGDTGNPGTDAAGTIQYTFDTTTTDSDPGAGKLRLSNATQNAATVIRTDLTDINGADVSGFLDTWDASTNTVKGNLKLAKLGDPTKFITYSLSARATPSGYRNFTVSVIAYSAANPFTNGDTLVLGFVRAGDAGSAGNASGDSTTNAPTASDITLTSASTRVQRFSFTAANLRIILPNATTLSAFKGAPSFEFINDGVFSGRVVDASGNSMAIIGPAQSGSISLNDIAATAGIWKAQNKTYDGSALAPQYSGSMVAISASAVSNAVNRIACAPLTANKFILCWSDQGAGLGRAVVIDVSGSTPTVGTPSSFLGTNSPSQVSVCALSATQAIVSYSDSAGFAKVINISGSTISSIGSAFTHNAAGLTGDSIQALSATTAIVFANDASNNLTAKVLSVSGSTITGGSAASIQAATATAYQFVITLSATKAIGLYQLTSSTFLRAVVLDISGTTITPGGDTALNAVASTYISGAALGDGAKIIVAFTAAGVNLQAFLLSVSGTTFTAGTASTIRAGAAVEVSAAPVNGRKIAVSYTAPTTGYIETMLVTAIQGDTTITSTGPNPLNATSSNFSASAVASNGKMLSVYRNGSSTFGNSVVTELLG